MGKGRKRSKENGERVREGGRKGKREGGEKERKRGGRK